MKDIECGKYRLTDLAVILLAALFCWCALQGTLELNPQGIGMDSDLQNYAQIMEAAEYPAAFALDPVASYFPRDPGVPNLLTDLAGLFPGGDNAAVDMLRVGSLGVFLHFLAYYILGRCLFRSPSLAVLLSILPGEEDGCMTLPDRRVGLPEQLFARCILQADGLRAKGVHGQSQKFVVDGCLHDSFSFFIVIG